MVAAEPAKRHPIAKPPRWNGKPAKITPETCARIAERVSLGLPLRLALAQEPEPLPIAHWNRALQVVPKLARVYDKELADRLAVDLAAIKGTTRKDLPVGTCWALERAFPHDFGQNRTGPSVQVNVNTVIGLGDDVLKRAAAHLRQGDDRYKPGQFKPKPVVDVQTIPQDKSA